MFTIDLIVGYERELLANHLVDQYIKNEKELIISKLYDNTRINTSLINIITNYSLSNICIIKSGRHFNHMKITYNKVILCVNDLTEISPYINNNYYIDHIYLEEFSVIHSLSLIRNMGKENERYINRASASYNKRVLLNKFDINFTKRENIERYKLNDTLFFHFTYDKKTDCFN